MAREQGTFDFSANFEVKKEGTLDARQLVDDFADLLAFDGLDFIPNGFIVSVKGTTTPSERGLYQCINNQDLANAANWEKLGSGGESPLTFNNGLTEANGVVSLGGTIDESVVLESYSLLNIKASQLRLTNLGAESSTIKTGVFEALTPNNEANFSIYGANYTRFADPSNKEAYIIIGDEFDVNYFPTIYINVKDLVNSNDEELLFGIGSNPAGWTGATIANDLSYLTTATIFGDRYVLVAELDFGDPNLSADALILDLVDKNVVKFSTLIPEIGNFNYPDQTDTALNSKSILRFLRVLPDTVNLGKYKLFFYDLPNNTFHIYDTNTLTKTSVSVGDAVTGDFTTVPSFVSVAPHDDNTASNLATTEFILEAETNILADRYLIYDIATNSLTKLVPSANLSASSALIPDFNSITEGDLLDVTYVTSSRGFLPQYIFRDRVIGRLARFDGLIEDFFTSPITPHGLTVRSLIFESKYIDNLANSANYIFKVDGSQAVRIDNVVREIPLAPVDIYDFIVGEFALEGTASFLNSTTDANIVNYTILNTDFSLTKNGWLYPVGYAPIADEDLVTKGWAEAELLAQAQAQLTFNNGLTETNGVVSLGGDILSTTTIQAVNGLDIKGSFEFNPTETTYESFISDPTFNGTGEKSITSIINQSNRTATLSFDNNDFSSEILLIPDTNNPSPIIFQSGSNPAGWTGDTIGAGSDFVVQEIYFSGDRYIIAIESAYVATGLDVIIFNTVTQTVTRLKALLPALGNSTYDPVGSTSFTAQIGDISVIPQPSDENEFYAYFFDRGTNIIHYYDSLLNTNSTLAVGDVVTGAVSTIPAFSRVSFAGNSSASNLDVEHLIIETESTNVAERFIKYSFANNTTSFVDLTIAQLDFDELLDKINASTEVKMLATGFNAGPFKRVGIAYILDKELIQIRSASGGVFEQFSTENQIKFHLDVAFNGILNTGTTKISIGSLTGTSNYVLFDYATNFYFSTTSSTPFGYGTTSFYVFNEPQGYATVDLFFADNDFAVVSGRPTTSLEIFTVSENTINIQADSQGFLYPATYSPELDNLTTRRWVEDNIIVPPTLTASGGIGIFNDNIELTTGTLSRAADIQSAQSLSLAGSSVALKNLTTDKTTIDATNGDSIATLSGGNAVSRTSLGSNDYKFSALGSAINQASTDAIFYIIDEGLDTGYIFKNNSALPTGWTGDALPTNIALCVWSNLQKTDELIGKFAVSQVRDSSNVTHYIIFDLENKIVKALSPTTTFTTGSLTSTNALSAGLPAIYETSAGNYRLIAHTDSTVIIYDSASDELREINTGTSQTIDGGASTLSLKLDGQLQFLISYSDLAFSGFVDTDKIIMQSTSGNGLLLYTYSTNSFETINPDISALNLDDLSSVDRFIGIMSYTDFGGTLTDYSICYLDSDGSSGAISVDASFNIKAGFSVESSANQIADTGFYAVSYATFAGYVLENVSNDDNILYKITLGNQFSVTNYVFEETQLYLSESFNAQNITLDPAFLVYKQGVNYTAFSVTGATSSFTIDVAENGLLYPTGYAPIADTDVVTKAWAEANLVGGASSLDDVLAIGSTSTNNTNIGIYEKNIDISGSVPLDRGWFIEATTETVGLGDTQTRFDSGISQNVNTFVYRSIISNIVDDSSVQTRMISGNLNGGAHGVITLSLATYNDNTGTAVLSFSNITNSAGLQYIGFGETSAADATGANYSTLSGTSLAPVKYVDDSVAGITLQTVLDNGSTFTGATEINIQQTDAIDTGRTSTFYLGAGSVYYLGSAKGNSLAVDYRESLLSFDPTRIQDYLLIGNGSVNNVVGFVIQSNAGGGFSAGINVKDAAFLKGMFYDADYSVNGEADDLWIPSWGSVKGYATLQNTLTGGSSYVGQSALDISVESGISGDFSKLLLEGDNGSIRVDNGLAATVDGFTEGFFFSNSTSISTGLAERISGATRTKSLTYDTALTGILVKDENDLLGLYYDQDFSANGILNDRWIADYGTIKANFATKALQFKTVSATTYTVLEEDSNKVLLFTSASGCTVTLPDALSVGHNFIAQNKSTGTITFNAATTLNTANSNTVSVQFEHASFYKETATIWARYI